jgi:amino acid adenylation domain-containing protein
MACAPTVGLLHQAVRHQAHVRPEQPAIVADGRSINYEELCGSMYRIARVLRDRGLQRNDRVGLLLDNGIEACQGVLGTLAGDGCYVPLPPGTPPARLAHMVRHAGIRHVLCVKSSLPTLEQIRQEGVSPTPFVLDGEAVDGQGVGAAEIAATSTTDVPARNIEEDLAYILYTSGSTGEPKGVMVTQRNVKSLATWAVEEFGFAPADRVANHTRLSFDLSVFDLFGAFFSGATLYPFTEPRDIAFPAQFLQRNQISIWFGVPALLGVLIKARQLTPGAFSPHLRYALFCGEALAPRFAAEWIRTHPDVPIANLYGPTEATVAVTCHHLGVDSPFEADKPVPIGRPTRDTEIVILKEDGDEEAAAGEVGRLMIGGSQVAAGYWKDPERTRKAFRANPIKPELPSILYDSGDYAVRDAAGIIHFLGRKDHQVKIRGYRIELAEIEIALQRHTAVSEAAAIVVDERGEPALVAAVALKEANATGSPSDEELLDHCARLLPNYMVPKRAVLFDSLPKNSNGKIDRPALKARVGRPPQQ